MKNKVWICYDIYIDDKTMANLGTNWYLKLDLQKVK